MTRSVLNNKGMTLVELLVAAVLLSLVLIGVYRIQRDVSKKADRESNKAVLHKDITTAAQLMEKDIRSAGYGIPGNGIGITEQSGNDQLAILVNPDKKKVTVASDVNATDTRIVLESSSGVNGGDWVDLYSGTDHQVVKVLELRKGLADTLVLDGSAGLDVAAGSYIGRAEQMRYFIGDDGGLYKNKKGKNVLLSENINTLDCAAFDKDGTELGGSLSYAVSVRFTLSGSVGEGKAAYQSQENTQVYMRNAGN
ncbi:MAG: prepilin-type N-terminal cleavage/methylation domain-containing protein [Chitinispirillaceae bacterium]